MEAQTGFVCNENLLTLVSYYFKAKWPGAILSPDKGERRKLDKIKIEDIPMGEAFVIYKDQKSLDLFEKLGWVRRTAERAILFWHIKEDGGLDLSFGEEESYPWVDEFLTNLRMNRLFLKTTKGNSYEET